MRPYIGITGVTDAREMKQVSAQFEQHLQRGDIPHVGMVGVLCSSETLKEKQPSPRHVAGTKALQKIMTAARGILPMLHIEIDKQPNNRTPFAHDVITLLNHAGRGGVGVQLNGYPSPQELRNLRAERPDLIIVLQLRKELIDLGFSCIIDFLENAEADVHEGYILIDPSAGTGKDFDDGSAATVHALIRQYFPKQTAGVAGGLKPENVNYWTRKLKKWIGHSNFSIDVESGVRRNDKLDTLMTDSYIAEAVSGLSEK